MSSGSWLDMNAITKSDVDALEEELYAALEYNDGPVRVEKPSSAEVRMRVAACRRFIEQGKSKSFIFQAFNAKWGLSTAATKRYIACARRQIREDICRSDEELIGFAHFTLTEVMANEEAKNSDRIRAAVAFMRLHGLEKPIKIAPTNPEGDKPYLQDAREVVAMLSIEQLRALAAARSVIDSSGKVVQDAIS